MGRHEPSPPTLCRRRRPPSRARLRWAADRRARVPGDQAPTGTGPAVRARRDNPRATEVRRRRTRRRSRPLQAQGRWMAAADPASCVVEDRRPRRVRGRTWRRAANRDVRRNDEATRGDRRGREGGLVVTGFGHPRHLASPCIFVRADLGFVNLLDFVAPKDIRSTPLTVVSGRHPGRRASSKPLTARSPALRVKLAPGPRHGPGRAILGGT